MQYGKGKWDLQNWEGWKYKTANKAQKTFPREPSYLLGERNLRKVGKHKGPREAEEGREVVLQGKAAALGTETDQVGEEAQQQVCRTKNWEWRDERWGANGVSPKLATEIRAERGTFNTFLPGTRRERGVDIRIWE